MLSILLVLLAGQDPAPAAAADPAPVVEAAPAELPIVRVPREVDGYSEAGWAAGHTGDVVVEVPVQPDGAKGAVTVVESSRSDLLDAEAVRMITEATLRPPAEASRYRFTVRFNPVDVLHMKCEAFVRNNRWLQTTWPETPTKDLPIYSMSVGAMVILGSDRGGMDAMLRPAREMEGKWPRLISDCERQPNRVYLQVLAGHFR